MAKIRGIEEQQEALVQVQANLKELQTIREFLSVENFTKQYELSFKNPSVPDESEDGKTAKPKKVSVKFRLSDRETLKLVLSEYEESLIKEIRSLTEQYNIDLDEEEQRILQQ